MKPQDPENSRSFDQGLDTVTMTGAEVVRLPAASRANVFSATGLAAGNDRNDRLKNAASTNTYIVVDAFDVTP